MHIFFIFSFLALFFPPLLLMLANQVIHSFVDRGKRRKAYKIVAKKGKKKSYADGSIFGSSCICRKANMQLNAVSGREMENKVWVDCSIGSGGQREGERAVKPFFYILSDKKAESTTLCVPSPFRSTASTFPNKGWLRRHLRYVKATKQRSSLSLASFSTLCSGVDYPFSRLTLYGDDVSFMCIAAGYHASLHRAPVIHLTCFSRHLLHFFFSCFCVLARRPPRKPFASP